MERTEQRNQIVRSESRLIAGVCGGLAVHLGIPVNYLRIGFLGLTALGGAGVLLYAWLWVFTPSAEESKAGALRSRGTGPRTLAEEMGRVQQGIFSPREMSEKLSSWRETLIGAALLLVALLALGQWLGLNIRWDLIWPSLGIIAGVLLAWLQVDGQHLDGDRKAKALVFGRLILGLLLAIGGLLAILSGSVSTSDLLGGMWAALAIITGAVVVLLPWGARLWRDYLSERSNRQAAAQRADFAAHLHDSVLQTLAVIQKRSDDPAAVRTLARVQERELRAWLYETEELDEKDVVVEIQAEADNVEKLLLRDVDVITVGNARGFDGQQALVAASREAMMNAAKHAEGTISVYVECSEQLIEVFIRDRGKGFDVGGIDKDRYGVRESIIGRMQRAGGQASIRSGETGTEVELKMPRNSSQEDTES
ncbi:histidine kinase [Arthrobacter sp. MYb224]|uniref:ATP-binding protein n=2 Tax=Micrococcaceae TaxID=1268 RepID=UPI000CFD5358|nr:MULTISPECIES: ATP-binding protein [unclassified Arthrobacter]PQZ99469.1 histidine kinase [Arthrobacter sp. MYb224]PRA06063.1 histidine kinase [Arthrobacter sp. MYb229]PRB52965.1 histidine kinase [Arthrobacter sp. MYb216]